MGLSLDAFRAAYRNLKAGELANTRLNVDGDAKTSVTAAAKGGAPLKLTQLKGLPNGPDRIADNIYMRSQLLTAIRDSLLSLNVSGRTDGLDSKSAAAFFEQAETQLFGSLQTDKKTKAQRFGADTASGDLDAQTVKDLIDALDTFMGSKDERITGLKTACPDVTDIQARAVAMIDEHQLVETFGLSKKEAASASLENFRTTYDRRLGSRLRFTVNVPGRRSISAQVDSQGVLGRFKAKSRNLDLVKSRRLLEMKDSETYISQARNIDNFLRGHPDLSKETQIDFLAETLKRACWSEGDRVFSDAEDYEEADAITVCKDLARQLVENKAVPRTGVAVLETIGMLKERLAMAPAVRSLLNDHIVMRLKAYERKLKADLGNVPPAQDVLDRCRERAIECLTRERGYGILADKLNDLAYTATDRNFEAIIKDTKKGVDDLCKGIDSVLKTIYSTESCQTDEQAFSGSVIRKFARDLLTQTENYASISDQAGALGLDVNTFIDAETDRLLAGLEKKTLVDVLHAVQGGVARTIEQKLAKVKEAYDARVIANRLVREQPWAAGENLEDLAGAVDSAIKKNEWIVLAGRLCDPKENASPEELVASMADEYLAGVKARWDEVRALPEKMCDDIGKALDVISTPEKAANLNADTDNREETYKGLQDELGRAESEIERQAKQFAIESRVTVMAGVDEVRETSVQDSVGKMAGEIKGKCDRFLRECAAKSLDAWEGGFLSDLENDFSGNGDKGRWRWKLEHVKIGPVDNCRNTEPFIPVLQSAVKSVAKSWIDGRKASAKASNLVLRKDEEYARLRQHVFDVLNDDGNRAKLANVIKAFMAGMSAMNLFLPKDYAAFRKGGAVSFETALAGRLETVFAEVLLAKDKPDVTAVFERERAAVVREFNQREADVAQGYLKAPQELEKQVVDFLRDDLNCPTPLPSTVLDAMRTFLEKFYGKYIDFVGSKSNEYRPLPLYWNSLADVARDALDKYSALTHAAQGILADEKVPGLEVNEARAAFVREHVADLVDPSFEKEKAFLSAELDSEDWKAIVGNFETRLTDLRNGTSAVKGLAEAYREAEEKDRAASVKLNVANYSLDDDMEQITVKAQHTARWMTLAWTASLSARWPDAFFGIDSVHKFASDIQNTIIGSLRDFVETKRKESPETFSGRNAVVEFFAKIDRQMETFNARMVDLGKDLHEAALAAGWTHDEWGMPGTMEMVYSGTQAFLFRIAKGRTFDVADFDKTVGTKEGWIRQIKGDIDLYRLGLVRKDPEKATARDFVDQNLGNLQDGIAKAIASTVVKGVRVDSAVRLAFGTDKAKEEIVRIIAADLKAGGKEPTVTRCADLVVQKLLEPNHLLDILKRSLPPRVNTIVAQFRKDLNEGMRRFPGLSGASAIEKKIKSCVDDLYVACIGAYAPDLSTERLQKMVNDRVTDFRDILDRQVFPRQTVSPFDEGNGRMLEWKDVSFKTVQDAPGVFDEIRAGGTCYYETEAAQVTRALKAKNSCDLFGTGYGKTFKDSTVQGFKAALVQKFEARMKTGKSGVTPGSRTSPTGDITYSIPSFGVNNKKIKEDSLDFELLADNLATDMTEGELGEGSKRNFISFLTTILSGDTFDLVSDNLGGAEGGAFRVETGNAPDGTVDEGRRFSLARDEVGNLVLDVERRRPISRIEVPGGKSTVAAKTDPGMSFEVYRMRLTFTKAYLNELGKAASLDAFVKSKRGLLTFNNSMFNDVKVDFDYLVRVECMNPAERNLSEAFARHHVELPSRERIRQLADEAKNSFPDHQEFTYWTWESLALMLASKSFDDVKKDESLLKGLRELARAKNLPLLDLREKGLDQAEAFLKELVAASRKSPDSVFQIADPVKLIAFLKENGIPPRMLAGAESQQVLRELKTWYEAEKQWGNLGQFVSDNCNRMSIEQLTPGQLKFYRDEYKKNHNRI